MNADLKSIFCRELDEEPQNATSSFICIMNTTIDDVIRVAEQYAVQTRKNFDIFRNGFDEDGNISFEVVGVYPEEVTKFFSQAFSNSIVWTEQLRDDNESISILKNGTEYHEFQAMWIGGEPKKYEALGEHFYDCKVVLIDTETGYSFPLEVTCSEEEYEYFKDLIVAHTSIKKIETLEEVTETVKKYETEKYNTINFGEFLNSQSDPLISAEVSETTKDIFYEMLHISPPVRRCTIDGVQMFCVSEMYDGSYANQYAKVGDKYYTATVDVYDQDTWIHKRLPNLEVMKDVLKSKTDKIQGSDPRQEEMYELSHRHISRKGR